MKVVGNDPIKTFHVAGEAERGGARRIERVGQVSTMLELLGRVPTGCVSPRRVACLLQSCTISRTVTVIPGNDSTTPKFLTRQVKCVQQAVYGQPRRNKP